MPSAGGDSDGKGGTKDAKHATGTGGWLKVPPGFPDDSYTIGLTSDEVYAVIPDGAHVSSLLTQFEGRDRNGRGMDGGTTFNINAHYKYQDEGSLRDDIRLLQMLADA